MRIGLILGDQLSHSLATLRSLDPTQDRIVMAEVMQEAEYVPHHPQKIALILSAMRHFAAELRQHGWTVDYWTLQPDAPERSLLDVLQHYVNLHQPTKICITECGEYRLQHAIDSTWAATLGCPVQVFEDDRFFCRLADFAAWGKGKKQLRMEFFYREMRKKTGYLMQGGATPEPVGGQWNFDADNRKRWTGKPAFPKPLEFERDAIDRDVLALVKSQFAQHSGELEPFRWATTRSQALQALDFFIKHALAHFGDYQDAMVQGEGFLFHSVLSPYMNCGLLLPREVCEAALQAFERGDAPLNAVEGFIRQILGWREYVRGIYWLLMPDYAEQNGLANTRQLPQFYWSGQTQMACMADSFANTFNHAYAHHIQRLMVTGNFALIAGIAPKAICEWYLAVYADAYEWVELPNTLGMVMHADGGYLGSKPYAASGNYIHKMSNHCSQCHYNVKTRSESDSCPFNSLYWHFLIRHREQFAPNPRMGMIYRSFDKMAQSEQTAVLERAEQLLANLDSL